MGSSASVIDGVESVRALALRDDVPETVEEGVESVAELRAALKQCASEQSQWSRPANVALAQPRRLAAAAEAYRALAAQP